MRPKAMTNVFPRENPNTLVYSQSFPKGKRTAGIFTAAHDHRPYFFALCLNTTPNPPSTIGFERCFFGKLVSVIRCLLVYNHVNGLGQR
jgi:hypothetical protein